jgi:hypothetical protein
MVNKNSFRFMNRREFFALTAGAMASAALRRAHAGPMPDVELGERPFQAPGIRVLNPFGRVPAAFIIDDSTALVNMGYYCLPQFQEAYGKDRYNKAWRTWPREIPDSFVREFGEFCREQGVKGKYSMVPYPACVGWLDRGLPGWGLDELRASLKLVREFMMPNWDIHPEMISHTRVIDIRTGRPLPQREDGSYWMENGGWDNGRSLDEIADYIAYALRILKNVDLPCEGFTTPGGFGNGAKTILPQAAIQALHDVFQAEIPHYFKYVVSDINDSSQPQVEFARGISGNAPECVVNIPSCTGDILGDWDGSAPNPPDVTMDALVTEDYQSGRLVEVINKGEPACFLSHWPGVYANGTGIAFEAFKGTVRRLNTGFGDRIRWMKVSEIARYWAAKELTAIRLENDSIVLDAPFATEGFTLELPNPVPPRWAKHAESEVKLSKIASVRELQPGTWAQSDNPGKNIACFNLKKGRTIIT